MIHCQIYKHSFASKAVEGKSMQIVINRALCDGNGNCAKQAPDIVVMDQDDRPQILKASFGEQHRRQAEAAVRSCPKNALSLRE